MILNLISLLLLSTMTMAVDSQKYVDVAITPAQVNVKDGGEFSLSMTLKPAKGIHINAEPAVTVKSDENLKFTVVNVRKSGDYLDTSKPLKVKCVVTGLKPGLHATKLVVTYTYCSATDGWCRMGKDERSVDINVSE